MPFIENIKVAFTILTKANCQAYNAVPTCHLKYIDVHFIIHITSFSEQKLIC